MQTADRLGLKGIAEIFVREAGGEWKLVRRVSNILTDDFLSRIMDTQTPSAYGYFAVGDGSGTPSGSNTALFNETFRKAVSNTIKETQSDFYYKWECYITTTEYTGNISEFGLFDAASAGNMMNHIAFASFYKSSTMEVRIDYYLYLTRL
ncbi:hypothetical protein [Geoglobus ahangari]